MNNAVSSYSIVENFLGILDFLLEFTQESKDTGIRTDALVHTLRQIRPELFNYRYE